MCISKAGPQARARPGPLSVPICLCVCPRSQVWRKTREKVRVSYWCTQRNFCKVELYKFLVPTDVDPILFPCFFFVTRRLGVLSDRDEPCARARARSFLVLLRCKAALRHSRRWLLGDGKGSRHRRGIAWRQRAYREPFAGQLDVSAVAIRLAVPNVQLTTRVLDASDEMAVQAFGEELDTHEHRWDVLICTAAGKAPHGPIGELPTSDTAALFASKFWTAHNSCKHIAPRLTDGGAVALTAGVLNRRPGLNCSPLAAVNGTLELTLLAPNLIFTRTRT